MMNGARSTHIDMLTHFDGLLHCSGLHTTRPNVLPCQLESVDERGLTSSFIKQPTLVTV